MKFHCFFEQSGTFKNEFKKLGYEAEDYDIQNEFRETDNIIDLFDEIEKGYNNEPSIFDNINQKDMILAFFPCVRFETQIGMAFRGQQWQLKNKTDEEKLEYDLVLHKELDLMYEKITKMTIICLRKNIPLIIENPYSPDHYLKQYWAIPCTFIDKDRSTRGDYYKKPTQYWFINCKPTYNMILEAYTWNLDKKKTIEKVCNKTERSMIAPEYANRFIREFILDKEV